MYFNEGVVNSVAQCKEDTGKNREITIGILVMLLSAVSVE